MTVESAISLIPVLCAPWIVFAAVIAFFPDLGEHDESRPHLRIRDELEKAAAE